MESLNKLTAKEAVAKLGAFIKEVWAAFNKMAQSIWKKRLTVYGKVKRGPKKGKVIAVRVRCKPWWRNFGIKHAATLLR